MLHDFLLTMHMRSKTSPDCWRRQHFLALWSGHGLGTKRASPATEFSGKLGRHSPELSLGSWVISQTVSWAPGAGRPLVTQTACSPSVYSLCLSSSSSQNIPSTACLCSDPSHLLWAAGPQGGPGAFFRAWSGGARFISHLGLASFHPQVTKMIKHRTASSTGSLLCPHPEGLKELWFCLSPYISVSLGLEF